MLDQARVLFVRKSYDGTAMDDVLAVLRCPWVYRKAGDAGISWL